jgi:hypothetical protein
MFEYTGQLTSWEEYQARSKPMQPRLFIVHDVLSGKTYADVSRSRDKAAAEAYGKQA